MRFDVPVMIAASIACLPICLTGHRISRWEGIVLLGYYGAYVAFLILDAANHDRLPTFSWIMLAFVMPLTALTFAVVAARRRAGAPDAA
jgi:cation:H+ antiporter